MRNNQNLPNRKIDSNNINGRQLPPTSPIYNNSRSRTPYRSQSRNNYNNNVNPRDNRNYQGYRKSHNYNNRSTSPEEISHLCDELQNIWNSEHYSEHFESTLKICSDRINFIEGLHSHVKITDQSQIGSSSFNLSRSLTSTSTPEDIQTNNNLQTKQKSTLKPDKQLTSNLFGNQQNIDEDIDISDPEEREIRFETKLPPSVNKNARRKYPMRDNRNNTYISSLNDNQEYHEQYWRQQTNNYIELKNEITATVTNHTNKLIDDLEMKYQQMNKRMKKDKKKH